MTRRSILVLNRFITRRTIVAVISCAAAVAAIFAVNATTATASVHPSKSVTIQITAITSTRIDTGVALPPGATVTVVAHGTVNCGCVGGMHPDANGLPVWNDYAAEWNAPGAAPPFKAPELRPWSLIGEIGSGEFFQLGTRVVMTDVAAGRLYMMFNDQVYPDNSGSFTVTITVSG